MDRVKTLIKYQGMAIEQVDTLVIGAGQAGIAMSEHLSSKGISHLVVEKARIAESWRTARWDSLVANGPAWHDRFPNMTFKDIDPDAFATKDQVVSYFVDYANLIKASVRTGVHVTALSKTENGFAADTASGTIAAREVVVATGAFQKPVMPKLVPEHAGIFQIHSNLYRNPAQLPAGAALVVGSGSSGSQIADELQRAGRKVFLSVGPHNKPPRRYRGHDFVWWLGKLGHWDVKTPNPAMEHVTIAVSGARGGQTVDFRQFARDGMTLVGRVEGLVDGVLHVADDLRKNIHRGDADYLSVLDTADAFALKNGLDLPLDPDSRVISSDPPCVTDPIRTLNLEDEGIASIIWATGYQPDFGWIKMDVFHDNGRPIHNRGVSVIPGLYFLGLPWLSRRASSFIWGVWTDAEFLAQHITVQRDKSHHAKPS
jgi:putative flavoprotein involved in K+ transport